MKNKKVLSVALATMTMTFLVGGSIYAANNQTPNNQNMGKINTNKAAVNLITEGQAKKIALDHAKIAEKDAVFVKVKLDRDDLVTEYEIEFYVGTKEYDYDINAVTGKVLSVDYDAEYYNPNKKPFPTKAPNGQAYITPAKAKDAALKHSGLSEKNITNLQMNFDYDDGVAEYEIQFYSNKKEYEYEINAITGAIISFEQEEHDDINIGQIQGNSQNNTNQISNITAAKAKDIALKSAGTTENAVRDLKVEFDYDDGLAQYEVEFEIGNLEYNYEIDAKTGNILSSEIDD